MIKRLLVAFATLSLVTAIGCDGDTAPEPSATTPDDNTPTETDTEANCDCGDAVCGVDNCGNACGDGCASGDQCLGGTCVAENSCTNWGFEASRIAMYPRVTGGIAKLRYEATQGGAEPPFDKVVMEFIDGKAKTAPGIYNLADDPSFTSCGNCISANDYCNEYDCFNRWQIVEGTMEILSEPAAGQRFQATLRGLKFRKARIDDATGEPKPAKDSDDIWCIDRHDIDYEVPEVNTQNTCVAAGTGNNIGDNVGDFTLSNALGQEASLHAYCGSAKAVWIVLTAGWCGACESFVPAAYQKWMETYRDQGVELLVVVGEDAGGNPPSPEYLKQYANKAEEAIVFGDNSAGRSWPSVLDRINNYASGSFGIPWSAVLRGSSMEYVWSNTAGEGSLYDALDALATE